MIVIAPPTRAVYIVSMIPCTKTCISNNNSNIIFIQMMTIVLVKHILVCLAIVMSIRGQHQENTTITSK